MIFPRVLPFLAAALLLGGCGGSNSTPAPATTTVTATVTPPVVSTTVTTAPSPTPTISARLGADALRAEIAAIIASQPTPGTAISIDGHPATVVIYGDGYGITLLATGGGATSQEFAAAVFQELTTGLNPTTDNVRAELPRSLRVSSPVTGQTYDMSCGVDDRGLISCTGGNGALVYAY